jgi:hypothetical protein
VSGERAAGEVEVGGARLILVSGNCHDGEGFGYRLGWLAGVEERHEGFVGVEAAGAQRGVLVSGLVDLPFGWPVAVEAVVHGRIMGVWVSGCIRCRLVSGIG